MLKLPTIEVLLLKKCRSITCRQAFLVCTGLCLCATAASAALFLRSRALYHQMYCRVVCNS